MSVINSSLATTISHVVAAQAIASKPASSGSGTSFGSATNVTLSAAAQSAVSSSQSSASGASSAPPTAGGGGGGGVPIATSTSDSTDTQLLVEIAEQQVIPKVGVTGASEVVDSKGDINTVKLNELINEQNQKAAPQPLAGTTGSSISIQA